MTSKKILILDYSTDKSETPLIRTWLPDDVLVTSLFIDTKESFPDDLIKQEFTHVIHSGSALSITKPAPFTKKALKYIRDLKDQGVAQMGICYGHQLICLALVGDHAVQVSLNGLEAGWLEVIFDKTVANIPGIGTKETVWQSHFDEVIALPEGSERFATNQHTRMQGFINRDYRLFCTQFHPEFNRDMGNKIFLNEEIMLNSHNYKVEDMVTGSPSIDTGKIFFGYFLENI